MIELTEKEMEVHKKEAAEDFELEVELSVETEKQELTQHEKIHLGTTEIAKRIREQLKKEYPGCRFSVVSEYYSMGSSITVALMKATFNPIMKAEEIELYVIDRLVNSGHNKKNILENQKGGNFQLNPYALRENYDKTKWCNGVFLTEQAHTVLKRATQIADQYNYNDSDMMNDYYSVNFSFSINIGKWNKDFQVVK